MFSEVQIPKSLEKKTVRGKGCGAEASALRGLGEELQREEKSGGVEGAWLNCPSRLPSQLRVNSLNDENTGKNSISLAKR